MNHLNCYWEPWIVSKINFEYHRNAYLGQTKKISVYIHGRSVSFNEHKYEKDIGGNKTPVIESLVKQKFHTTKTSSYCCYASICLLKKVSNDNKTDVCVWNGNRSLAKCKWSILRHTHIHHMCVCVCVSHSTCVFVHKTDKKAKAHRHLVVLYYYRSFLRY